MFKVLKKNDELKKQVDQLRKSGHTIGFVPTLGALHMGHISLINKALHESDSVICSIFVNPTQFNETADFKNYPRTLEKDLNLLKKYGCHLVFAPSVESIYPTGHKAPKVNLNGLDNVMEGAHRPGHFNGVIEVVHRLFKLVNPDKAFFGEKDFQQLAIIKHMVKTIKLPVEVIGCPIIREKDGLAMSSRNRLLTPSNRKKSASLHKALKMASVNKHKLSPYKLKREIESYLKKHSIDVEYFEIVDELKLRPIKRWYRRKNVRAFVTARLGNVRLIDNMRITYRPK